MREVKVTLPDSTIHTVPYGTRVEYFFENNLLDQGDSPAAGAFVNNEITSLTYKIRVNSSVVPVYLDSHDGIRMYRDSLTFLVAKAAKKHFPGRRLVISNSLGSSYFFYFDTYNEPTKDEIDTIREELVLSVEKNLKIERKIISYQDAVEIFDKKSSRDAALLLKYRNDSKIAVFQCEDYIDLAHLPLVPETGMLKLFDIMMYSYGFLLRFPAEGNHTVIPEFKDMPELSAIYQEYKSWGKIQKFSSVGELNEHIAAGNAKKLIAVAEALHTKKIAQIADRIAEKREKVKVVLIAGPSSSGKTTFAKKLSTQLQVVGFNPLEISLDDYYVERENTPRDENGGI